MTQGSRHVAVFLNVPLASSLLFPHDGLVAKGDELQRVGRAVAARRGHLGMTQQELADEADVDLKTIYNLESGTRWPIARTRTAITAALGWAGDALTLIADGQSPPEPAAAPAARPEIPNPPSFLTPEEKTAANPAASRLFDRIAKVGAGRDPATVPGQELFAGEDDAEADVLADGWDAVREGALRGAFSWDDAVWFAGLAFHRNARAQERRRPRRSGTQGA